MPPASWRTRKMVSVIQPETHTKRPSGQRLRTKDRYQSRRRWMNQLKERERIALSPLFLLGSSKNKVMPTYFGEGDFLYCAYLSEC